MGTMSASAPQRLGSPGVTRRMWLDDALRAGVYLAIGVLLLAVVPDVSNGWGGAGPLPPAPPVGRELVVLAAGCLGLLLRRARPMLGLLVATAAVALAVVWLGRTHIGITLVFGEALYSAVLHSGRRTSAAVSALTGLLVAGLALGSLAAHGTREAVLSLLGLSLLVIPVAWAREVRHHREATAAAEQRVEQARRVAELDRAAAVAAERARMARDLHDVVAGQLSAIAIQSAAALTLPDADPRTRRRLLEAVREGSVSALTEMRAMIGVLRADDPAEPRTAPAGLAGLPGLLDTGRASGLRIDLDDRRPTRSALPAAVDLTAFRIVQESLTNAAKHAPGSAVSLRLGRSAGALTIEVANPLDRGGDGGGTGTGLLGLRERADAVGGTLRAGADAGWWTVRAELPVPA
jgi:signal transduction histidine kinase